MPESTAAVTAEPVLLKPSEVCQRLRISNDKLHALIDDGTLKAIKLGPRTTRIYEESVSAVLAPVRTDD